jgi:hypothetical protein
LKDVEAERYNLNFARQPFAALLSRDVGKGICGEK